MEAYRKAWAAYAAQQYDDARHLTASAIRSDPTNPHTQALAGDLAYLAHQLGEARTAWTRALQLEPRLQVLQARLQQLDLEEALEQGQTAMATERFVIRAPTTAELDLPWLMGELDAVETFLERHLQMRLEGPVTVLIYPEAAFYGQLHVPTTIAGLFDGKVRLPVRSLGAGLSLREVLWHEVAHAAVHQLTHGHAPRWLHEGVAQVVQAHVGTIPKDALSVVPGTKREMVPGTDLLTLADLEGRAGGAFGQAATLDAQLFYRTSFAHAQYVVDHFGWVGLRRLLVDVGQGRSTADALQSLARLDEPAWDRAIRRSAKGQVRHRRD